MSLLRAEIRNRLGDSSIYDGVVEYKSDFETEKMLASVHAGSMMLCLNCDGPDNQDESVVSNTYIKREDGTWEIVKRMTNELTPTPSGAEDAGKVPVVNRDGTGYDLAHIDPDNVVLYTEQALSDDQKAQARANIGAISVDEIGTVFTLKGGVTTVADLPASGNRVGDVYYVEAVSAGYIWLTSASQPNGYWEELGETIDLSAYELKPVINAPSGDTPTITPEANTIYNCGELTSLTISNPPATGSYSIVFTSGATPTQTIIPPSPAMQWQTDDNEPPQGFPAANTRYEINVKDTYVVLGEWPVPEVSV